ncbi:MAG: hypothetical protein EOO28_27770 [Comamonadaceae bacterium]|nr:MAG: hypothetical protein EOO28_27770 [Comamonadaceae bacterium]
MLHPLFSTLVRRPDLMVDHVAGYAALFHQEATAAGADLLKRGIAWAIAGVCCIVFLGLAGTALMLGFMQNQFHWILLVVPGIPLVLMAIAVAIACRPFTSERFPELKAQIESDSEALRMAA